MATQQADTKLISPTQLPTYHYFHVGKSISVQASTMLPGCMVKNFTGSPLSPDSFQLEIRYLTEYAEMKGLQSGGVLDFTRNSSDKLLWDCGNFKVTYENGPGGGLYMY